MKIRITGKGLPKAQMWNSQIGKATLDQNGLMWGANPGIVTRQESKAAFGECGPGMVFSQIQQTCISEEQARHEQQGMAGFTDYLNRKKKGLPTNPFKTTGNEGTASNPMNSLFTPVIKPEEKPENPGDLGKLANTFNKIGKGIKMATVFGSAITNLADAKRKEKDFSDWKRKQLNSDYLFTPVAGSRGDYVATGSRFGEFRPDEYVVNKGMYTGQFFPRMMQSGGVIPEALSFPIDEIEVNITTAPAESSSSTSSSSSSRFSGANPEALETWDDISSEFKGVENWGIWGDKKHRARKSDHNSGDALDIGITSPEQGNQIAQKLIKEAQDRNISYIIWNKQIWNPSVSNDWRPYSGENDHTSHVHVSFNRNPESLGQISLTHNNPLNIHQGDFAQKYGGKQGSKDGNGFVSMFPDLNTGIRAAKDLLFGPNYSSLTISEARNKWVKGDTTTTSESSSHIVRAMGGNKKISDLSDAEKEKLLKLFAKWEGKQAYNKIKDMKLFKEGGMFQYSVGGVYELTEDEIKSVLAAGGEVEFI